MKRMIKVRSLTDGWISIDADAVEQMKTSPWALRMLSGSLILFTPKEGQRVLSKLANMGIKP